MKFRQYSRAVAFAMASFLCVGGSVGRADIAVSTSPASQPSSQRELSKNLFDPARHMRVSEVRPGMTGYGLSVFHGTSIDRFDVEVLSVLKNFNPKYDVVLIRAKGQGLEHTASIAGMSGSPIFLRDDAGKDRMIGAFAYGWPLMKDPIAGVQPIEYMLALPDGKSGPATTQPDGASSDAVPGEPAPEGRLRWSLDESVLLPGMRRPPASYPLASLDSFDPNPTLLAGSGGATRPTPLATPLMVGGMSPTLLAEISPVFKAYGLMPLQAGGATGSAPTAPNPPPKLEPGSTLAVPLLSGDVDMSAVGTCTEVIGDRVFGFGHAFNGEGTVALPMGSGSVQGVIANYMTSFKIGSLYKVEGMLTTDQTTGIAGRLGAAPAMVPIDLRVVYADGSQDISYHFDAALHPKLTPLIIAAALQSAVSGAKELPQYHTLDYDLSVDFANGQNLQVVNTAANATVADLFFDIGNPIIAAGENPFERVGVKRVSGTIKVTPTVRLAQVLYANLPRVRYQPGETAKAFVTYRPFRSAERVMPVEIELPRDLPDGTYQLTISDWQKYLEDQRAAEPFRFEAESVSQVFDVLRDVTGIRRDAVYVRLLRQPDGVAIGRTAMPKLPSSRREVLIGAGRSDTTQFVSSALKVVPTNGQVMSGSAQFDLTIDRNAATEQPGGKLPRRDVRPAAKAAEESGKTKPNKPDAGASPTTEPSR